MRFLILFEIVFEISFGHFPRREGGPDIGSVIVSIWDSAARRVMSLFSAI
jgi:hypothetical protein